MSDEPRRSQTPRSQPYQLPDPSIQPQEAPPERGQPRVLHHGSERYHSDRIYERGHPVDPRGPLTPHP